jgi:hypothetical protein
MPAAPDGKRMRRKVSGKTKQEVRAKLRALHQELNADVMSSSTYTVRDAVEDWLREGLAGTSERMRTLYEGLLGPLLDAIGARSLRDLSAGDVRSGRNQLAARYSTQSLQITRLSLEQAKALLAAAEDTRLHAYDRRPDRITRMPRLAPTRRSSGRRQMRPTARAAGRWR